MGHIIIHFDTNSLGRVDFGVDVMTSDRKSFEEIRFKLDCGSDFTTISCDDLTKKLGYTREFLESCPFHGNLASLASHEKELKMQYITNVSIKFGTREIQGCRIFFALDTKLRSLFGSDILKYFNWEVNYDDGELRLAKSIKLPRLSENETLLHIYSVEEH